uniref:Uncharacterized protein n=1 Tax=Meloidogyne enterolobii TaxID=390850 RepID=A0A6V7W385_MELEN|nr:unnamed protein product [Meloidogyne enterolobii]
MISISILHNYANRINKQEILSMYERLTTNIKYMFWWTLLVN